MNNLSKNLSNPQKGIGSGLGLILGAGVLLATATQALYNVDGGYRAIVFNKVTGVKQKTYAEGTHFKIPFIEKPVLFTVRSRPYEIASPPRK